MKTRVSSRLLALGVIWGLLLATVPALVMRESYQLTGLLVAVLLCAALSGCIGTLAAGRRAARNAARSKDPDRPGVLSGVRLGALQGLVGGGVAALLFWVLMVLITSAFSLQNPVDVSTLMRSRVFLGSFFVALSVFLYAFVGGLLLGPLFGPLINRTVKDAGSNGGEKEDPVVR
jgi:hypothetical protein